MKKHWFLIFAIIYIFGTLIGNGITAHNSGSELDMAIWNLKTYELILTVLLMHFINLKIGE